MGAHPSAPPPSSLLLLLLFASILLTINSNFANAQFLREKDAADKEGANAIYRVQDSLVYSTRPKNDANARSLLSEDQNARRNDFPVGEAEQEALRAHRVLSKMDHYELHDLSAFFKQREELKRRRRLSNSEEFEESVDLEVLGQRVTVSFSKFTDLFGAKYAHKLVDRNMNVVRTEPALDCFYRAKGENLLRGSIALCKDQEMIATFFGRNDEEAFGIKPVEVLGRNLHAVYFLQDELKDLLNKDYPMVPPAVKTTTTTSSRVAGDGLVELEGESANSVATPFTNARVKYAGIMQINDNGFHNRYEVDTQLAAAQVMAGAKVYYDGIRADAPYRVIVEMSGMITFVDADPWTQPKTSSGGLDDNALLSVVTNWKNQAGIEADIVHFLIGTPFTQAAGWGWIGTACGSSNVGETEGLHSVSSMAAIAAHEIGHVLNMQHDDVVVNTLGTSCASNPGRMGRRLAIDGFTECSIEWLRIKFAPGSSLYNTPSYPACMEIRDYTPINENSVVCGDGVVEGDEQCDCPNKDCTNVDPCCNGSTCRLKAGATCSGQDPCCNKDTCNTPMPQGTLCRASRNTCDLEEVCDGASMKCPVDERVPVGETCVTDVLRIQGTCTCDGCRSLDASCKSRNSAYSACSFKSTGDAACDVAWCNIGGSGCTTWGEGIVSGQKCGDRMACNANKKCVPVEDITCWWSPTKSPTPPTTRSPTRSDPTFQPSRAPTKAPQPHCGNGIIDAGEECDCGLNCASDNCCDGQTCRLKAGAQCSRADACCNPSTCQVAASGTVCRNATDSCDMPESCNGVSKSCPADQRQPLGTDCTTSGVPGKCNCNGCTSIEARCKQRNALFSACSFTNTCGPQHCYDPRDGYCWTWGEAVALGYSCGANMGCSGGACVPLSSITCPWMTSPPTNAPVPSASPIVTSSPTTKSPTSKAPTSQAPTTKSPTTASPTSKSPTTASPTSKSPTTASPTSQAPTSKSPTTASPTSKSPTTASPTSQAPTSQAPTSKAPTTLAPTSKSPTTASPTSQAPTSKSPTTASPTSGSPTTASPTSQSPTTASPTPETTPPPFSLPPISTSAPVTKSPTLPTRKPTRRPTRKPTKRRRRG